MNGSGKRGSSAWSFLAGTAFGALAMLALPAGHAATAAGSSRAAVRRNAAIASPVTMDPHEAVADPGERRAVPGHSELVLQLD